jgi:hypothetical protein
MKNHILETEDFAGFQAKLAEVVHG